VEHTKQRGGRRENHPDTEAEHHFHPFAVSLALYK
jgi:hypothetical protein